MKKSTLYAPRLKGDIDLGLEPSRVDAGGDKRWADIITPGGLLPGKSAQGVLEENSSAHYRIGTRRVIDERVYRYAHMDPDRIVRAAYGAYAFSDYEETGVVALGALISTYVLTLTEVGTVVVNEYAEGYAVLTLGGYGQTYKIKSNTVATVGEFTVTLYDPLVQALTLNTDIVTLYHSPYYRTNCMRQEFLDGINTRYEKVSFVGIPNRQFAADSYGWLQTWGPCGCILDAGNEGAAARERGMVFGPMGSIERIRDLGDGVGRAQRAGFVMPETTGGNMPGAIGMIFLQIAP